MTNTVLILIARTVVGSRHFIMLRCMVRFGYTRYKNYIQCRENIIQNALFRARNIFCFVVFHFFVAVKNVFSAVSRFVNFVVSDSRHLCRRKLQNWQNGRQRQKHFLLQQKNEKQQNKKCFERSYHILFKYFVYFYFPVICIQRGKSEWVSILSLFLWRWRLRADTLHWRSKNKNAKPKFM